MDDKANLKIIVIDDNVSIHRDFIKILTTNTGSELDKLKMQIFDEKTSDVISLPKFQIDTASQGNEGVERIKQALDQGNPYALAFVDVRMPPGWDGIETIKHIWELDQDIQIVICTAYSDYSWEETISQLGLNDNLLILKKPFDNVAVRQLACALTKKWQLMQDARKFTSTLKQQVEDRTVSLQESLSLVKATLESSNDGVLVINNQGEIVDYNQSFINMWKVPRAILDTKVESKLLEFMNDQLMNPSKFHDDMEELHANQDSIKIDIIDFKDGVIFEYYTQPQKINNQIIGRVFDFRDITKRANLEKSLEHQARHDALTGLPNRIMLHERILQAKKISEKNNSLFALFFIDFDRFKLINDSLSHAVGDDLLRAASDRLKSSIRPEDTLARLGGDEFVIILTNIQKEEYILERALKVINIFQVPFNISGKEVTITASIGISIFPKDGKTGDNLLRNADAAMYCAKEKRGNNFQLYTDEMNSKSLAKLDHEAQFRHAMANNELFLCYQPQINLKSGKIVSAEALVRWQHPEKGILLPLDFIPLAEETGLIVQLGEWVMRKACAQNKAWQDAGLSPIRVAVNVTAQQFAHQNLVELVRDILKETQLSPEYLELELTENVIVSNIEIINAVIELKKLGVTIAIDDFGTGYSSLSYLKKIPLDRLKIDSSFVQHITNAEDDEVIIRAVISMAKSLNLEVLAEGVETQDQINFLKAHECGDVQGFYFSKPLNIQELEDFLKDSVNTKMAITEE